MKRPDLPYVVSKNVKGRTYHYFRRVVGGKEVNTRLPDNPDSEEFAAAYWAIRSGRRKQAPKHTWDDLVKAYRMTPRFRALAKGTRDNYERHLREILAKNSGKSILNFRRSHAIAARDTLSETWSKANERVSILSQMMNVAVDKEWIERNPVVNIEKLKGGEYEAWPEDKLRAFERCCDATGNHIARTAYELCLGTGQRIGDAIAMRWDQFSGEYMVVVQEKTGEPLEVYCPTRLQDYLGGLPKAGRHILARNLTQPLGKRTVQRAIESVRDEIGALSGETKLVPHGWRYTAVKQLAEAGCSDAQIQAVTGHRTLSMVQKYRKQADQKKTSRQAQMRREQNKDRT